MYLRYDFGEYHYLFSHPMSQLLNKINNNTEIGGMFLELFVSFCCWNNIVHVNISPVFFHSRQWNLSQYHISYIVTICLIKMIMVNISWFLLISTGFSGIIPIFYLGKLTRSMHNLIIIKSFRYPLHKRISLPLTIVVMSLFLLYGKVLVLCAA